MESILITGATGYIGSNLTKYFVKLGKKVSIIVRPESNLGSLTDILNKIEIYHYHNSIESLNPIFEKHIPNVIFHLAGKVVTKHQPQDIEGLIKSNILFGTQLLDTAVKFGVKNFINTGTFSRHFNNDPYNPSSLYDATKQALDDIIYFYVQSKGIRAITLELFNVYGPNDQRSKIFPYLLKCIRDKEVALVSPGEQQLDFVNIEDVLRAYEVAAKLIISLKFGTHEIFSVHSGEKHSLKEIIQIFIKESKQKLKVKFGAKELREREVTSPPYSAVSKLPGWESKISLSEGIRVLIQENMEIC